MITSRYPSVWTLLPFLSLSRSKCNAHMRCVSEVVGVRVMMSKWRLSVFACEAIVKPCGCCRSSYDAFDAALYDKHRWGLNVNINLPPQHTVHCDNTLRNLLHRQGPIGWGRRWSCPPCGLHDVWSNSRWWRAGWLKDEVASLNPVLRRCLWAEAARFVGRRRNRTSLWTRKEATVKWRGKSTKDDDIMESRFKP